MLKSQSCIIVCLLGVAACGGSEQGPLQPAAPNTFRVLTSSTSDTIGATLPLQVQARTGDGKPRAGAMIRFSLLSTESGAQSGIVLAGLGSDGSVTIQSGTDGIASLAVALGDRAGSYGLTVAEAGITRVDTITFEVSPGNAVRLDLTTRDTMTTMGGTYTPIIRVFDRKDNSRSDTPTLSTSSTACTISGPRIIGAAIGNCLVAVHLAQLRDSIRMAAVPNVAVVATAGGPVLGDYLLTMNLDGSGVKYVRILPAGSAYHPSKIAAVPFIAVHHLGPDQLLHVFLVDTLGNERPLAPRGLPANSDDNWPSMSPDGQWVYFSSRNDPNLAARAWRAHLDGTSASPLTPIEASFGWYSNFPEISADGTTLAYADQGLRLRLLNLVTGQTVSPPVSADGLICAHPKQPRFATIDISNFSIVSVGADGSGTRTIADSVSSFLQYMPDGEWILTRNVSVEPNGLVQPGDRVLLNELTGQRVRLTYSMPIHEIAVIR